MAEPRHITEQEYVHERLGERFEHALSNYDTQRRVETLINEFLPDEVVRGKTVLDVGCGLGFFSQRLKERGAVVTACDIGPGLIEKTRLRVGCEAQVADALRLTEQFGANKFDLVLSSECIEHTPDPNEALRQMAGVLKPGGFLSVSTPNVVWWPVVRLATVLRLRPFDGHERFSTFGGIRKVLSGAGVEVDRQKGLHSFPFQFGLHGLSRWCDGAFQFARPLMINLCVRGRKK